MCPKFVFGLYLTLRTHQTASLHQYPVPVAAATITTATQTGRKPFEFAPNRLDEKKRETVNEAIVILGIA